VNPHPWGDDFGEIMGLVPCAGCGELVSKVYLRVVGDSHMCIPCSGYEH
jgi:formylmethanofuran dehydrogenase subunit E